MDAGTEQRHYETCPVCASGIKSWRVKKVGDSQYNIDLCSSCGFAFVNPRPSFAFLLDYYASFGHIHDTSSQAVPTLQSVKLREQKDENSTIDAARIVTTIKDLLTDVNPEKLLDVGCGYGFFSKAALDSGFDVVALELAENEREIAKQMTGLTPHACSFEEFDMPAGTFSVVLMSQILEHALDMNHWMKKANNLLASGGVLAVALPNYSSIFRKVMQENEPYITPPEHLNYFSPRCLSQLFENHGFKVEAILWVSRVPKKAFEKRLPAVARPLLPVVALGASVALKAIDALKLGMIIMSTGGSCARSF